jgi:DNA-binding transcriptional regulator YiaG
VKSASRSAADAGRAAEGSVIRYLRNTVGLTQEELAQALGITVGTVSRWEKGRFRPSRLARTLILNFARTHNVALDLKPAARAG